MKFCKVLEGQDKDFPELNHMFLRYKELKKKIKKMDSAEIGASGTNQLSSDEQEFIAALNEDMDRFNSFFMEKEEDAVIRLQSMSDQLQHAVTQEQLNELKQDMVNYHGELVLILHWSLINYSAIVKILKKHDKRTRVLLRAPYLANVLQQPFSSTNVMTRLVKTAEELVEQVEMRTQRPQGSRASVGGDSAPVQPAQPQQQQAVSRNSSEDEGSSLSTVVEGAKEPSCMAERTKMALEMWTSLAKTASTPSTILTAEPRAEKPRWSDQGSGQTASAPPAKRVKT